MSISHALWTKALDDAGIDRTDNQDALSATELGRLWKCSPQVARQRVLKLLACGQVTRVQKYYLETDGRRRPVPAYLLVKNKHG